MSDISLSPSWIRRIDATLLPWLQKQLHPDDGMGNPLDINGAMRLNLSFGADSINLEIPSGGLVDHENLKLYETRFVASQEFNEMPEDLRASLGSFLNRYNEEYESLRCFDDELSKAGIPTTVSDFTNGYLGLLLGSDWRLFRNWDQSKIDEDEWEETEDDIRITILPNGTVSFYEPDDDGMVFPDIKVDSPRQLVELLARLANALSKKMDSQKAIGELNSIFGSSGRAGISQS